MGKDTQPNNPLEELMNNEQIAPTPERFRVILGRYIKHSGLEIEVTLKSGETMLISKMRKLEGDEIIQFGKTGESGRIHLAQIKKAEVFAV